MNEYDVVLADPPWPYKPSRRSASQHYPTMSVEDIGLLNVAAIAARHAALFLWVTWPHLLNARLVLDAWGFRYVTCAWVWVKMRRSGIGLHAGMGHYSRGNSEPCLLAIRGSTPTDVHDVLSVIMAPVRQHSRKPDEQYDKIERMYPHARRIELFARRRRPGWDAWGNEIRTDLKPEAIDALLRR